MATHEPASAPPAGQSTGAGGRGTPRPASPPLAAVCERGYFPSHDGTRLYHEIWSTEEPRAAVLLVHGYFEHCGRHARTARFFVERGFSVVTFDYRGHGQAAGVRGHVERFDLYLEDLDAALAELRRRPLMGTSGRFFLLGHSHGGLVALRYLLERPAVPDLLGLVVSAPFIGIKAEVPAYKRGLASVLSGVLPTLALPADLDTTLLCHDAEVCKAYLEDPWVNRAATVRWFTEVQRVQKEVLERVAKLSVPSLFLQGSADGIVDPEAARRAYELVTHEDKTWRGYPGLYHELFNEPEREAILADVAEWMEERLPGHGLKDAG